MTAVWRAGMRPFVEPESMVAGVIPFHLIVCGGESR